MKTTGTIAVIAASLIIAASCINNANSANVKDNPQNAKESVAAMNSDTSKYDIKMMDNKRDLVCRMPLTAGIGDTAHYKGKVYGFCSKGCKETFLKDPESYLKESSKEAKK